MQFTNVEPKLKDTNLAMVNGQEGVLHLTFDPTSSAQ